MQRITDLETPIGEVASSLGAEGGWFQTPNDGQFAIVPLDDDLIDHFAETNPAFIAECEAIRQRARAGHTLSLKEVKRTFSGDVR